MDACLIRMLRHINPHPGGFFAAGRLPRLGAPAETLLWGAPPRQACGYFFAAGVPAAGGGVWSDRGVDVPGPEGV